MAEPISKTPHLVSIQVGLPKRAGTKGSTDPMEQPWYSGIFKEPIIGPVWLSKINLAGDRQADLRFHGGPDKAVLAYAASHYPGWREELGLDMQYGAFGENFTIDGLTENEACIGDIYAVGEAVVQISQPRQPCWKLAHRLKVEDMITRVHDSGCTGWYLRVIKEGYVEQGLFTLLERPYPQWTISNVYYIRYNSDVSRESVLSLTSCPALSEGWQASLRNKAKNLA